MFTIFFLTVLSGIDGALLLSIWFAYRGSVPPSRKAFRVHLYTSIFLFCFVLVYRLTLGHNYISLDTRRVITLFLVWFYFSKLLTILIFWGAYLFSLLKFKKKPKNYRENSEVSIISSSPDANNLPTDGENLPADADSPTVGKENLNAPISRAKFLERVGLATGGITLGLGFWGTSHSLYDYQVRHINLPLPNLPKAFHGIRIAQISDIHTGSLTNVTAVKGGFEMLMREKADIICFTGDLVNYESSEIHRLEHLLATIRAPLGVFSCLGNHDYGDYSTWKNAAEKARNLQMLIDAQKKFNWNLLIDSHAYITEGKDQLAIIGVGNWSKITRFPRYGNLSKAYQGINPEVNTQILLSHDPTHWDAEIRKKTPNIALTLSGHTHGMQLGIDVAGFRVSPSRFMFEQWADLYQKDAQYIYVNRGFGYSDGFPIRLGILPEITVFTLSAVS